MKTATENPPFSTAKTALKTTHDAEAALARARDKCADAAAACREVASVWEEMKMARQPDPDTIVFTDMSPSTTDRVQSLAVAAHTVTRELVEVDRLLIAARDAARKLAAKWESGDVHDPNTGAITGERAREQAQPWNDFADAYDRALQLRADAAAIVDMPPPGWSQARWKSSCGK